MAGIEEHRSARDPAKVVSDYFRLEHLLLIVDTYFVLVIDTFCFFYLVFSVFGLVSVHRGCTMIVINDF